LNSSDIKSLSIEQLNDLSKKIRDKITNTVSKNGGHLSSPLGAVELIIAMHHVFDVDSDPFIFDVSHQAYAHKLLTGRWEEFETLRQFGGISGFTKPSENKNDYFIAGHSSTSISVATGAAKAFKLKNENKIPVAFIGDGSMSAGMVYEALNELGDLKLPVVIVLNDNEMSIAKPIGAISRYLSEVMAGKFYQKFKKHTSEFLKHFPDSATYMAKRVDESLKLITPGLLFEELGIEYIGPVDGHNIEGLIKTFKIAKQLGKPVIVHAQTLKGKGYQIAEGKHENWHGVGPFDINSGQSKKKSSKSATGIFANTLIDLATKHENIVGITAAMPSGTGLDKLMERFPERFWDVAIAEQHAVTSAAALAKEGFKPFVAIYSTFLQRAYDQIIHDVCIMKLPVVFAIDRAGIVGEDGETHQGVFDISYLRHIPNMTIFAPRCEESLKDAMQFAYEMKTPCAFRYPRGNFEDLSVYENEKFELGKSQLLKHSKSDILFIGFGNGVGKAYKVYEKIKDKLDPAILDLRFVKPLDKEQLINLSLKYKKWFVFSESAKLGGVWTSLVEFLHEENIDDVSVKTYEYDDKFVPHGNKTIVEKSLGISVDEIIKDIVC
jgi:1-deoxy-D-xylulose-5-phosphate synthase